MFIYAKQVNHCGHKNEVMATKQNYHNGAIYPPPYSQYFPTDPPLIMCVCIHANVTFLLLWFKYKPQRLTSERDITAIHH